jgi:small subunit ribosomal protein S4
MARSIDPACKRCRREQMKLFLKGSRCFSPKCPIDREARPPGMHGATRTKQTEYGIRLREKQRLKWFYGLLERQFSRYLELASKAANTGDELLVLMERRLDNCVHRLGFAASRKGARQLVAHGHVMINGRKCDVPSVLVKPGDVIKVKPANRSLALARLNLQSSGGEPVPDYLEVVNREDPEGKMNRLPTRGDVDQRIADIRVQLIIEIATR